MEGGDASESLMMARVNEGDYPRTFRETPSGEPEYRMVPKDR